MTKRKSESIGTTKGIALLLSDGITYQFSPLTLNRMEAVEEQFDMKWSAIFEEGRMKHYKFLFYILLRDKYPDMTIEKVGDLVDLESMGKMSDEINRQLGI